MVIFKGIPMVIDATPYQNKLLQLNHTLHIFSTNVEIYSAETCILFILLSISISMLNELNVVSQDRHISRSQLPVICEVTETIIATCNIRRININLPGY